MAFSREVRRVSGVGLTLTLLSGSAMLLKSETAAHAGQRKAVRAPTQYIGYASLKQCNSGESTAEPSCITQDWESLRAAAESARRRLAAQQAAETTTAPSSTTSVPPPVKKAAPATSSVPASGSSYPSDATFIRLSGCESTGNWQANTGNGFYGGVQFTETSWVNVHGTDYAPRADLATEAQQIEKARELYRLQGWDAWPHCSLELGLR
jgi:hypothetical protein